MLVGPLGQASPTAIARPRWHYCTVNTRKIQLQNVELTIAEAGVGGRPFLMLHGFTGAKEDFTDWIDQLANAGWHVVAPDHRGHGESSKPETEYAYSIAILADDAIALVDQLGWAKFVLLGHSMGGFIAQNMALRKEIAARLDALILMDTRYSRVDSIDESLVNRAIEVVRTRGMNGLADMFVGRENPLDTPSHRRLVNEDPGYADSLDRKLRATSPYLYMGMSRELTMSMLDTLDGLRGLPAGLPTLVIVGEEDLPFIEPSKRMAEAIPGARLAVIPRAGHSPQFENPKQWWAELSEFLGN
jgi:3-oxoadipate enol-lactonase